MLRIVLTLQPRLISRKLLPFRGVLYLRCREKASVFYEKHPPLGKGGRFVHLKRVSIKKITIK